MITTVSRLLWAPDPCEVRFRRPRAAVRLRKGQTTATITSTTQVFRPVSAGTVRAVAVPLNRGRTTATIQTSLYDEADRLIAQPSASQRPGGLRWASGSGAERRARAGRRLRAVGGNVLDQSGQAGGVEQVGRADGEVVAHVVERGPHLPNRHACECRPCQPVRR
jgi:hypothetical protein